MSASGSLDQRAAVHSARSAGWWRRAVAAIMLGALALAGIVAVPSSAIAAPNAGIVVDEIVIGGGTGPGGQLVVGDTISIDGTWDASSADPHAGDTFTIGLPSELQIPEDVPFTLSGPDPDGNIVDWATCLADASTGVVTCTLTEEVELFPELVHGEFSFDVTAVEATTEEELVFDLNGEDVPVDLPGDGGIDDGVVIPDDWGKSGEMNDNNWSMTWTIDLPGSRMQGEDVITIADTLGAGHVLCEPAALQVQTVRGTTVVDVTDIATLVPGDDDQHFSIALMAPEPDGFDPDVTYRITYDTCTPDGQIDPEDTEYTNEATIDVWGESSGIIGVNPNPWQETLTKSGSVLGGGDRNGRIAWTVTVPGDQLVGKDGFNFSESLGAGHEVCEDTISGITVTERYGPSNQLQRDVTEMLESTVVSESAQAFEVDFAVSDPDLVFQPSDYRYVITYSTCVSQDGLPSGGTAYTNEVEVDGEVAGTEADVPGRTDEKAGSINTSNVTLDGVEHLAQTTLDWRITVPGERLVGTDSAVTVTDTLSGGHEVCVAGDPTGGLSAQLGLQVEARDQIQNGGLATVDLSESVTAEESDGVLTFTIPEPTLVQPDGGEETGFSAEYQYVITYTTCTSSGGMDAQGTTYGNSAEVAGKTYEKSVTQNNRGSGSGEGVPRGSVSIQKSLADTDGAALIPDDAMFTVHVQEFDPAGTMQIEYDLEVPVGGDPVSGPNSRGTGWTVVLTEPSFPSIPGVVFGAPVFAPGEGVTVGDDGTSATAELTPGTNIAVNLTNEAQLGSVSLVKELSGGAADLVDADRVYPVTASIDTSALGEDFPQQADRELSLVAGEPAVIEGLPIGAVVTFTETPLIDDDQFTWGEPVFSPASVTVTADHAVAPAEVTLTNTVERSVGTFSLIKLVTGDEADNPAVPDAVTVTATWEVDGERGEQILTVPTDGTALPFDVSLPVGTEVTLTETPLEDGAGIAWAAPVWSGTGVVIDGESAIVTVTRDADATVTLDNHAATSTAGISIMKGIAGAAASEVDPSTEFPVTATWTDANGDEQSRDLSINTEGPTALGEELPAGTIVTFTEGERPNVETVVWDSITISGDGVTDNGDGSAQIVVSDQQGDTALVTVVNEATWAPGTFALSKSVTGILPDNPGFPGQVTVNASWFVDGEAVTETLTVPTDGESVEFGQELARGTEVTLSESPLDSSAAFTWDTPEWEGEGVVAHDDGTATLTIGAATDAQVVLTNHASAVFGSLVAVKSLDGDGAAEIPDRATFPVTATWTDLLGESQQVEFELVAGAETVLQDLPLGTAVTLTESATDVPDSVTWVGGVWSSQAGNVTVQGDGSEAVVTVTGDAGMGAEIELTNTFDKKPDLAITGSQGLALAAAVLALIMIGGGALLVSARRRHA